MESTYHHRTIRKKEDVGTQGTINSLKFTPDRKYIIIGSMDKTIKIWELSSCRLRYTLTGHKGSVFTVAVSPNGKFFDSESTD